MSMDEVGRNPDYNALAGELVNGVEQTVAAAPIIGAVLDEVVAPYMIVVLHPRLATRLVSEPRPTAFRLLGQTFSRLRP